eukprot:1281882-Amphidinium_carterae.2
MASAFTIIINATHPTQRNEVLNSSCCKDLITEHVCNSITDSKFHIDLVGHGLVLCLQGLQGKQHVNSATVYHSKCISGWYDGNLSLSLMPMQTGDRQFACMTYGKKSLPFI